MKTLLINTHPEANNHAHVSQQLLQMFLAKYHAQFGTGNLDILNLYHEDIPPIDQNMLAMWNAQAAGHSLSRQQQALEQRQNELLAQFKGARRIVIVAPTHNFNITTKMKDYMDNILIARQTFRYTDTGSVGLMTDGYRVLLLAASGSIYTNEDRYTPLEFQHFYLKGTFCDIMGFESFQIVRAQGTAVRPADEVMADAARDLDLEFQLFYQ